MADNMSSKMDEFDSIRLSIASSEDIEKDSFGEVTKPETINYRTQKPEKDGLFDERIFGPTKDFECYCGKYKKIRYKGVVCDKCGVEVTRSTVRRERMGHIKLVVPVAHIWYFRGNPSQIGLVLDLTTRELERVVYFGSYVVLDVDEANRKLAIETLEKEYQKIKKQGQDSQSPKDIDLNLEYQLAKNELLSLRPNSVISETKYLEISMKYGQIVKVGIGAEAVFELLKRVDLKSEIAKLKIASKNNQGQETKRNTRRLKFLSGLYDAQIKPEWMVLTILPVLPPDLRPMVQLDGGRFAASDLNDLYRRVINRNNRLKRLIETGAPEVICRNEKRMLQEAVDALIDNSAKKEKAVTTTAGRRQLKSLSDMLRGKQGRFRQNLLGKRVDYSGRSVIVVGPQLKINECGLPKTMALELFKPLVIAKLIADVPAHRNVKNASKMIEMESPEIWDILEQIIKESYVLLNRAPTLHRLGIQAFKPVLIEGKSIEIHPFVCTAYNADFDGDQMAVYLPLSEQAIYECEKIMLSLNNYLKPASGAPIMTPNRDAVLGLYYLTLIYDEENTKAKKYYSDIHEAIRAHESGSIGLRDKINVEHNGKTIETSIGRIVFNESLPIKDEFINKTIDDKTLKQVVNKSIHSNEKETTAILIDSLKELGFYWATRSGLTFAVDDIKIPDSKNRLIEKYKKIASKIYEQYEKGLIADNERYMKEVDLWTECKSKIEADMLENFDDHNPIYKMVSSGARGSVSQLTQIAGMKGLVTNPAGRVIEIPVESNYKEGLSEFEYFISSHGARKGRADMALRTSDSGYLTRRLVDVSQDVVVSSKDCKTKNSIVLTRKESEEMGLEFGKMLIGRNAAEKVIDPKTKKTVVGKEQLIDENIASVITDSEISDIKVYSVLTCENRRGVCQKCYGRDLAYGKTVELGTAVGIIAAQAIGEPGTQLTMRTFHLGGVAGIDITQGLPRIEEIFEARTPRVPAIICDISGRVSISKTKNSYIITVISKDKKVEEYTIGTNAKALVKSGEKVREKRPILMLPDKRIIRSPFAGVAEIRDKKIILTSSVFISREYETNKATQLLVSHGDTVSQGDQLSEGHWNLNEALRLLGHEKVQKYILREVQNIYASQGQTINIKHIELIARQMFSKLRIIEVGDTRFLPGEIVSKIEFEEENKKAKNQASFEEVLLGISTVAINTESFLSAASFQETTNVLIRAATTGKIDYLRGLKENVIIGRTIPAGTGYPGSQSYKEMQEHISKRQIEKHKELKKKIRTLEKAGADRLE